MNKSTSLIRIRFPYDLVDRLDRLAERLRLKGKRKIPRAALVRALVQIHMPTDDDARRELDDMLGADPVKRGREKGPQVRRRADTADYRSASRA